MSARGTRVRRNCLGRGAVASIEFGMIAPVLAIFLMAMVDLAQAVITLHRLNTVVQQTGLMATSFPCSRINRRH